MVVKKRIVKVTPFLFTVALFVVVGLVSSCTSKPAPAAPAAQQPKVEQVAPAQVTTPAATAVPGPAAEPVAVPAVDVTPEISALEQKVSGFETRLNTLLSTDVDVTSAADLSKVLNEFGAVKKGIAGLGPDFTALDGKVDAAANPQYGALKSRYNTLNATIVEVENGGAALAGVELTSLEEAVTGYQTIFDGIPVEFASSKSVDQLALVVGKLINLDDLVYELDGEVNLVDSVIANAATFAAPALINPIKTKFADIKVKYDNLYKAIVVQEEALLDTAAAEFAAINYELNDLEEDFGFLELECGAIQQDLAQLIAAAQQQEAAQLTAVSLNNFGALVIRYAALVSEGLVPSNNAGNLSFAVRLASLTAEVDEVYAVVQGFSTYIDTATMVAIQNLRGSLDDLNVKTAQLNDPGLVNLGLEFVSIEESEYDYLEYSINLLKANPSDEGITALKAEFDILDAFASQELFAQLVRENADVVRFDALKTVFRNL
jgi:hypothetical protein